ncbi:MAG: SurA N-terminal domain-containing protein, partial [Rhizobiales bacterium]|nr:SurA N-terminal domain-containing protein [Hyphomicrobiales bacterium]
MLDSLRNAAKSWVAKVLIFLLAASFGVWGIADVFTGYRAGALATVGDEEISGDQFTQAFSNALQRLSQGGQRLLPEDARKLGIDRQVLFNLIQSAAVIDQGKTLGLSVGDDLIVKETQLNPAFLDASGKFDADQFRRILQANNLSEQMYLAGERETLLRRAITDTVDGDFPASKTLIEAFYRHRNEQRNARYFVIKTADSEATAPTDTEIKAQYDGNPETYTAPEYRIAAIIKAEPEDVAARINLGDDELQAGYEKYKGDYFTPEKRTILQMTFPNVEDAGKAKQRITAGEDFMAIAVERGLKDADVTFADKIKTDFFDKAVADAAFSLAQDAVSDPIRGSLAVSLIKVARVSPEHQKTFEEAKEDVGKRLRIERAREEIDAIYSAVEDGRGAQTKFEEIAKTVNLPFQLIDRIDAAGQGADGKAMEIPRKEELLKAIFASDVGVDNNPLPAGDGYIWYEVREVIPAKIKPLDTVRQQVIADLTAGKVRRLAADKAKAMVERAKSGVPLETMAQEAGTTVQTAQGLKRSETNASFDGGAIAALFSVPENGFAFALEPDG